MAEKKTKTVIMTSVDMDAVIILQNHCCEIVRQMIVASNYV